jgi:hypothetical protein
MNRESSKKRASDPAPAPVGFASLASGRGSQEPVSLHHAMRTVILALLLLPLVAFAEEVRVAVGQSRDEVVGTIKKHGATDITPGMAIVGPKGEHPLTGIYWEFRDYDVIIELTAKNGKVVRMLFWTKKNFGKSRSHRAKTEQSISTLKLDTKTRGVRLRRKKQASPY